MSTRQTINAPLHALCDHLVPSLQDLDSCRCCQGVYKKNFWSFYIPPGCCQGAGGGGRIYFHPPGVACVFQNKTGCYKDFVLSIRIQCEMLYTENDNISYIQEYAVGKYGNPLREAPYQDRFEFLPNLGRLRQ